MDDRHRRHDRRTSRFTSARPGPQLPLVGRCPYRRRACRDDRSPAVPNGTVTTILRAAIIPAVASAALAATACAREASPDRSIDSAFAQAESTYWRGAPDSAEIELNDLLRSAEARGEARTAARAVTALAVVAYRRSDYDAVGRLGARALTMPLRGADRFRANNVLGLAAYYQSRYRDAAAFLDRAIEE